MTDAGNGNGARPRICVPNTGRENRTDLALGTSFGFGGHNACLAFSRVEV